MYLSVNDKLDPAQGSLITGEGFHINMKLLVFGIF